jgi:glycosyltransferase involved in cell wall biosynthesis
LTVSDYSKNRIVWQMRVPEERIFVTPEGVDLKLFRPLKRKPPKLFKILVHGAADERKNIPNILRAAQMMVSQGKVFQMIIIGMDENELKCTDYVQQVIDLGLGSQVEWAGNVPPWTLNQVYADVDLFLYPSLMEGFGLPVLEAFACGVPVITSNTTSLPEVAGNAGMLVDPKRPEAIAKAIGQMMKSKALRKQYVRRGLSRAKQFSWEKTAKMTLKVYKGIGGGLS